MSSQVNLLKDILLDVTQTLQQTGLSDQCCHDNQQTQSELLLLNCLKLLRNLCAGVPANQLEIL